MARPSPARERILDAAQRLTMEQGFGSTTVEAVLDRAGASKGAFFHHFPTKADLGHALVERYIAADAEMLDGFMRAAEQTGDDPAEQVVDFVRRFEEASDAIVQEQPSCLLVSFIYEARLIDPRTGALVAEAVVGLRDGILDKLEKAASDRPGLAGRDLPALADQAFTTFEGAFLLARALDDPGAVRRQLAQYRSHLELLLGLDAPPPAGGGEGDQAAASRMR